MEVKYLFFVTLFVVAKVERCFCAVALAVAEPAPGDPGSCLVEGKTLGNGESFTQEGCTRVTCHKQKDMLLLQYASCGSVFVSPECKLVEDLSQEYPDCCPVPECIASDRTLQGSEYEDFINWLHNEYYETT